MNTYRPWIVVPCFNEEDRLDRGAFEALLTEEDGPIILFVDDGSADGTAALLAGIAAAAGPGRCRVITAGTNQGKAEAVRAGMRAALETGATRVGFWDADLATPLPIISHFSALLDRRPDIDVVIGSRVRMLGRQIERSVARHLIGRVYATLASVVLGLPVYDTQCGAKLFRRSAALEKALDTPFRSRWSFDVELLQRLQHGWGDRGLDRIVEVPLQEWRDVGRSNVSAVAGVGAFAVLLTLLARRARGVPLRARSSPGGEGQREHAPTALPTGDQAEKPLSAGNKR